MATTEVRELKEKLRKLREYDDRIAIIENEINTMYDKAMGVSAIQYDAVKVISSPSADRLTDAMSRISNAKDKLAAMIIVMSTERELLLNEVLEMRDKGCMKVIYARYFDAKTRDKGWDDISNACGFERRYVLKLHGRALIELSQQMTEKRH